ncbi:MAG: hypothetical protein JW763_04260 [candidate division Zixibacteria bacterium]|nr:hypothetical protein [candidate division Zixibacteria bacterium]
MDLRKYAVIASVAILLLFVTSSSGETDFTMSKGVGDANRDGKVNILDIYFLMNYIYGNPPGPAPVPLLAGDADLDGNVDLRDMLTLIHTVFTAPIVGEIIRHSGCLSYAKDNVDFEHDYCLPDGITYSYNGTDVLNIKHTNAGFNCCPIIHATISRSQQQITIEEYETYEHGEPCTCLCLFDVEYQVTGLPPGVYTLVIMGLYLNEEEYLTATINLVENPVGEYTVPRYLYPWCLY